MEEYETDLPGVVVGRDLVGRFRMPWRCLVPADRDIERNDVAVFRIGNSWPVPPVDKVVGDVEQEIRNGWHPGPVDRPRVRETSFAIFGPMPGNVETGGKQGVENRRAHLEWRNLCLEAFA